MLTAEDLSKFIKEQERSKQKTMLGKRPYGYTRDAQPLSDDSYVHQTVDAPSYSHRADAVPSRDESSQGMQAYGLASASRDDSSQAMQAYGLASASRDDHGCEPYERAANKTGNSYVSAAEHDGSDSHDNNGGVDARDGSRGYDAAGQRRWQDMGSNANVGARPIRDTDSYQPQSKLFSSTAATSFESKTHEIARQSESSDCEAKASGDDYDASYSLKDRQLKTLEIFDGLGYLLSEEKYDTYVRKMKLAQMDPFPREAVFKFNIDRVFAKHGLFASKLPGYSPRKGQQRCANYVAEAIKTHQFLAVEAGTGTGKTFAYLVPPLLAGKSVVVSTRTKALQGQLISKDIPNLFNILDADDKKAISLKGYSNYICRRLLDKQLGVNGDEDGDKHAYAKQESLSDEIERDLNAAKAEAKGKLDCGLLEYLRHFAEENARDIGLDPTIAHYGELDIQLPDSERKLVSCDSKGCHDMCHFCRYFIPPMAFYERQASHERETETAQSKAIYDAGYVSKGPASAAAADVSTRPVSSIDDASHANVQNGDTPTDVSGVAGDCSGNQYSGYDANAYGPNAYGPNAAAQNKGKEAVFDQDAWSNPDVQVQIEPLSFDSKHKCVRSELIDEDLCFVQASRQDAKARDVVVVNHALLCTALQSLFGMGREGTILPIPDVLVIDEAHTFVEVYRDTNTRRVDFKELIKMVNEAREQLQYKYLEEAEFLAFMKNGLKLQRLVEILIRSLTLRGEGKFGLAQFKYCHIEFASPFEVMRFELFNSVDRMYLGDDSYTMQEVYKEMNLSGRRMELWFRDNFDLNVVLAKAKKRYRKANGEVYNSSEDGIVALDNLFKDMHKRAKELDDDFSSWVKRRFADICARHNLNYNNINPLTSDMADVRFDSDKPVVNKLFRALMADIVSCLESFKGMLSVASDRILQNAQGDQNSKEKQKEQVISALINTGSDLTYTIVDFMNSDRGKNGEVKWEQASWVEIEPSEYNHRDVSCSLTVCPIDVGPMIAKNLRELRQSGCSVVFTSATMTSAQSFDKFIYDLGLTKEEVTTYLVPAPFDYAKQACLLTSPAFPDVDMGPGRMAKCLMMLQNLIAATSGGIFILTTSYTAVNESYEYIKRTVSNRLIIKQGDMPVAEAMRTFIENGNAILIGTSSFWEGVDVPGKALSMVIIDKLPFAQITDPFIKVLQEKFKSEGRLFFVEELLPAAIITLRQGAGRLIRKETDTGALVILDPRVHNQGYRKTIFNSLPPMTPVRSVAEAISFIRSRDVPW